MDGLTDYGYDPANRGGGEDRRRPSEQAMKTQREVVAEVLEVALGAGLDHDRTVWEQAQDLTDEVMEALAQHEDQDDDERLGSGEPFARP